jgi:hypothetical protein
MRVLVEVVVGPGRQQQQQQCMYGNIFPMCLARRENTENNATENKNLKKKQQKIYCSNVS